MLEGRGSRVRAILVLLEYIWKASAVSLVFPAFDEIGSLGSPSRQVLYPLVPAWVTAFHFLAGNREAELKPTTLSSIYFSMFSCLSSFPNSPAI